MYLIQRNRNLYIFEFSVLIRFIFDSLVVLMVLCFEGDILRRN